MIRALINGEEFRITFKHHRVNLAQGDDLIKIGDNALAHASTICEIRRGPREAEYVDAADLAYCSVKDNFSRPIGRAIALNRAIKGYDEETQRQLKKAYVKRARKQTSTPAQTQTK